VRSWEVAVAPFDLLVSRMDAPRVMEGSLVPSGQIGHSETAAPQTAFGELTASPGRIIPASHGLSFTTSSPIRPGNALGGGEIR